MKTEQPWVEETREFFGLVILVVVLLIDYFYRKRKRKQGYLINMTHLTQ